MNIKIKDGECFGSVFVVVFNNDGFYDPRVFTEREKMIAFTTYLDNLGKEYNVFEETLDREYEENYRKFKEDKADNELGIKGDD